MATPSLIELLEPRIAPATFVNAFVVTYTDVDGDLVKVTSSRPVFHDDLGGFTFTPAGDGEELSELLLNPSASGTNLTIRVIEPAPAGDGVVNVGRIYAPADLGSVKISGSLEGIMAGDRDPNARGIGLLHVHNLDWATFYFGAGILRIDGDLTGEVYAEGSGRSPGEEPSFFEGGDVDKLIITGDLTGTVSFHGSVGKIEVGGDIRGSGDTTGFINGAKIGTLLVGGSIIGDGSTSGHVRAAKGIGVVVIEGDIVGGPGFLSGSVHYGGNQNQSFWLGGSLIGGGGEKSGSFSAKQTGTVTILGDLVGGSNSETGAITTYRTYNQNGMYLENGKYDSVHILGNVNGGGIAADVRTSIVVDQSVIGTDVPRSGSIEVGTFGDALTRVKVYVGGDLVGGSGAGSGFISALASRSIVDVTVSGDLREVLNTVDRYDSRLNAGSIVGNRLGQVTIGGSVFAAEHSDAETRITSYAVLATTSVDRLKIAGDVIGTSTNVVGISAGARPLTAYNSSAGIGNLIVGGDATFIEVSAGYSNKDFNWEFSEFVHNPDAKISKVRIDGNLVASSITAGIHPGADSRFGTGDDYVDASEPSAIRSRIASIIVGGQVKGTADIGDAFGIAAQRVNSITIGGVPVSLTSELDTIQLAPDTYDVLLREHA